MLGSQHSDGSGELMSPVGGFAEFGALPVCVMLSPAKHLSFLRGEVAIGSIPYSCF